MPPSLSKSSKLGHEENRYKTCAICLNESARKAECPISTRVAALIREHVDESYELNNARYGASLCKTCDFDINRLGQGEIDKLRFQKSSRFGERIPIHLRSNAAKCQCIICERATLSGGQWNAFRKMWKKAPGRKSTNSNPGNNKSVRCDICLTEVFNF